MPTPAAPVYAWNDPRPYIGRCPRCRATVAVERTLDEQNAADCQARCPECRCWVIVSQVAGKYGKRECGAWCTEGTGKSCTCTCGGRAHGQAWRIKPW